MIAVRAARAGSRWTAPSIAWVLKDRATQSFGPVVLQNDGFACTGVKSPMSCAMCENAAIGHGVAQSELDVERLSRKMHKVRKLGLRNGQVSKFGGARARVCNDSPSKVQITSYVDRTRTILGGAGGEQPNDSCRIFPQSAY